MHFESSLQVKCNQRSICDISHDSTPFPFNPRMRNRQTDGLTNQITDGPSCRDACTHLEISCPFEEKTKDCVKGNKLFFSSRLWLDDEKKLLKNMLFLDIAGFGILLRLL